MDGIEVKWTDTLEMSMLDIDIQTLVRTNYMRLEKECGLDCPLNQNEKSIRSTNKYNNRLIQKADVELKQKNGVSKR